MKPTRLGALRLLPWAGAGAAILLLIYTIAQYGPGATADSVAYISAGRSLTEGQGFWRYDERYYISWPPVMPVLIAVLRTVTRLDWDKAAFIINPVAYAGTVFVVARAFVRRLQTPWLAVVGTVLALLSYPLLRTSSFLWSEPLFNFGAALILALLWEEPATVAARRWQVGLLAAAFAVVALTRYIGFIFYVPIVLWLLLDATTPWRTRLWRAVVIGAPAAVLMGAWLVRNYLVSGTFAGTRQPTLLTWHDNLYRLYAAIESWFTAVPWLKPAQYSPILVGIAFCVLLYGWFERQWVRAILPVLGGAVAYAGFLIYSTSRVALDPIDSRLASPLYIPLVFIVVLTADSLLRGRSAFGRAFVLVPLLFGYYAAGRTVELVKVSRQEGVGGFYRARLAPLATALADVLPTGTFYSNSADAFYFMTLQRRARWVPSPPQLPGWAAQLRSDRPTYLVWFSGGWGNMATPDEIGQVARVSLVREVGFAKVFSVKPK